MENTKKKDYYFSILRIVYTLHEVITYYFFRFGNLSMKLCLIFTADAVFI